MINIMVKIEDPTKQWVVFRLLHAETLALLFVGCCPLSRLLTGLEWRSNGALEAGTPIMVHADSIHSDTYKCNAAGAARVRVSEIVRGLPSVPEMNRAHALRNHLGVMCNETGESFPNAYAAVQAHKLTVSALSNHLNGNAGYKTVKDRTYRYLSPPARPTPPVQVPKSDAPWRAITWFDKENKGFVDVTQGSTQRGNVLNAGTYWECVRAAFEWLEQHGTNDAITAFKNDYGYG